MVNVMLEVRDEMIEEVHEILQRANPTPLAKPAPEYRSRKAFFEYLAELGMETYRGKVNRKVKA